MQTIPMTPHDHDRLGDLVDAFRANGSGSTRGVDELDELLTHSVLVEENELPADVVTMNSQLVVLDLETGELRELSVVFPAAADFERGRISILAPAGQALLGRREGDEVTWQLTTRVHRVLIEAVRYQPEASGDLARLRASVGRRASDVQPGPGATK